MRKFVLAVTLLTAVGAIAISGSLYAGHNKSMTISASKMDPTELTVKATDLPVVQVNEPF